MQENKDIGLEIYLLSVLTLTQLDWVPVIHCESL